MAHLNRRGGWVAFGFIAIGAFIAGMLAGCRTTENIKGRDSAVYMPTYRATLALDRSRDPSALSERNRASAKLELEMISASGDSDQRLAQNEFMEFSGALFNGPGIVTADYSLQIFSLSGRFPIGTDFPGLTLEPIVGLSGERFVIELESAGVVERDQSIGFGPRIGIYGTLDLVYGFELFGQATSTAGWGDGAWRTIAVLEAGIAVRPIPHFVLIGGWRSLSYREERGASEAEIDLRFAGPIATLALEF